MRAVFRGEIVVDEIQERWLTYRELGELLGCTANAARMLAKRRGWSRRTPNAYGDKAMVLVPDDADVQPRSAIDRDHMSRNPNGADQVNVRALEIAVETLRDQLGIANRRVDEPLIALADARTAEMISGNEAAVLRAQLELLAGRRPWRRWFR